MLFKGFDTIIYLKNGSIEVLRKGFSDNAIINFPKEVFNHLEIWDEMRFSKLLTDFFISLDLKTAQVVILLSKGSVFEQSFSADDPTLDQDKEKFYNHLPIEPDNLAVVEVSDKEKLYIFTTNRSYFSVVGDIVYNLGWELKAISPISLIGEISENVQLDTKLIQQIFKSLKIFKEINFFNKQPNTELDKLISNQRSFQDEQVGFSGNDDLQLDEDIVTDTKKQYLMLIFSLILIVGSVSYAIYSYINSSKLQPQLKTESTTSAQLKTDLIEITANEATDSTIALSIENPLKSELKIQILNGSDVVGQAARAEEELLKKGYKSIEIGNFESTSEADTKVDFSNNVPLDLQQEILKSLEALFSSVRVSGGYIGDFDIKIITGSGLI